MSRDISSSVYFKYSTVIVRPVSTESKYIVPGPGIELTITISANSGNNALIQFSLENLTP